MTSPDGPVTDLRAHEEAAPTHDGRPRPPSVGTPSSGGTGTCPRCGRAGSMVDLGNRLVWCEDCNVGWTDEDDDPDCHCGRDDRTDGHRFEEGCDAWEPDMADDQPPEPVVVHELVGAACSCRRWAAPLGTSIWRGFDQHLLAVRASAGR